MNSSMNTSPSRMKQVAVAVLCASVLLLGGVEATLRCFGIGNPILIVSDPSCGYTLKPEQDVYRFFEHTRINRYGMRSDEVGAKGDAIRILFLGDSITYGTTQVDQRDIFTEILRRELPPVVGKSVQVLNASAGAWAIGNELEYVRSRGFFDSDIVVLVLNSGDLTQPFSTISDVGDGLPIVKPSLALEELYTRYLKPKFSHRFARTDAGTAVALDEHAAKQNIAKLDTLASTVKEHGAKLAIFYIPFRVKVPDRASGSAQSALIDWAKSNHAPLLDLTSGISGYAANQVTLDGVHLNTKGNRLIADTIEQQWRKRTDEFAPESGSR